MFTSTPATATRPPTLAHFFTLSLLIHVLVVMWVGTAPGAAARRDAAVWGPLSVSLRGVPADVPAGLTVTPERATPARASAAPAPAPRAKARKSPTPTPSPAPVVPTPPVESVPVLRPPEPTEAPRLDPEVAPPSEAPSEAPPEAPPEPPSEPAPVAPSQVELNPPVAMEPPAPPAPAIEPREPIQPIQPIVPPGPQPEEPAPVEVPPPETPPPQPVAIEPTPPTVSPVAPVPAPDEPPAAPPPARSPTPADVAPASPPTAAPAPAVSPGRDAPDSPGAAASAPPPLKLDLASPLGRDTMGRRPFGLLPLLPPPPERKSKLAEGIEKSAKPDCRTAHSGKGLLAVVPLAVDAVRGDGCRW